MATPSRRMDVGCRTLAITFPDLAKILACLSDPTMDHLRVRPGTDYTNAGTLAG